MCLTISLNRCIDPEQDRMKRNIRRQEQLTSFFLADKPKKRRKLFGQKDGSRFSSCPLCEKSLPLHLIESHAAVCSLSEGIVMDTLESNKQSIASVPCPTVIVGTSHQTNPGQCGIKCKAQWDNIIRSTNDSDLPKLTSKMLKDENCSEPLPGLYVFEEFISEEEEKSMLHHLDRRDGKNNENQYSESHQPWKRAAFNGKHMGKRWGVHCSLRDRRVYHEKDQLPACIANIIERVCKLKCFKGCIPNEANAIDYYRQAGDYLKSHIDDRQLSKEPIANLSLAGDCRMMFRLERDKMKHILPAEKKILLKRRTLQIMTGRARYDYSHGIENQDLLSERRVSITMRESPLTG